MFCLECRLVLRPHDIRLASDVTKSARQPERRARRDGDPRWNDLEQLRGVFRGNEEDRNGLSSAQSYGRMLSRSCGRIYELTATMRNARPTSEVLK